MDKKFKEWINANGNVNSDNYDICLEAWEAALDSRNKQSDHIPQVEKMVDHGGEVNDMIKSVGLGGIAGILPYLEPDEAEMRIRNEIKQTKT